MRKEYFQEQGIYIASNFWTTVSISEIKAICKSIPIRPITVRKYGEGNTKIQEGFTYKIFIEHNFFKIIKNYNVY